MGEQLAPGTPGDWAGKDSHAPAGFVGCDETIERLYVYLDGELTEERRVEITRHLDMCGPCVGAYGFETELRKVIANRCRDRVPEDTHRAGRRGAPRGARPPPRLSPEPVERAVGSRPTMPARKPATHPTAVRWRRSLHWSA